MSVESIRTQHAELNRLFEEHYDELSGIESAVKESVRTLVAENDVGEEDANWAMSSLDIPTVFRFFKKHKWNRSATIQALTTNALWRIQTIPSLPTPSSVPLFRFIHSQDRYERPILIIRARHIAGMSKTDLQNGIITMYELARLHIGRLYGECQDVLGSSAQMQRVLQFVVIADLEGLGIRNVPTDIVGWLGQSIIPNYPGIIGPAYIINYSWAYNGIWQMSKRMLPQRAIARIVFPSITELHQFIPPQSLLQEHGGTISPSQLKRDPLLRRYLPQLVPSSATASPSSSTTSLVPDESDSSETTAVASSSQSDTPSTSTSPKSVTPPRIHPRSTLNPYFGYPITLPPPSSSPNSVPTLSAGRRRKRDLLRTLLILFLHRLSRGIPNLFLVPIPERRAQGVYGKRRRKVRSWIWWTLLIWLAASLRRAAMRLRIRGVGGVMSAVGDGRIRSLGLGVLVGGELVRRVLGLGSLAISGPVPVLA